jgi:hypothetical protein
MLRGDFRREGQDMFQRQCNGSGNIHQHTPFTITTTAMEKLVNEKVEKVN